MIYQTTITVMVQADNPEEAIEKIVGELDYLFGLDNDLIAYTHPQTATEETTGA